MEDQIKDLQRYLRAVNEFALPKYKELPSIDLYMEQVLKYINQTLESLDPDSESQLTSFMVNNYVKAKMISEPVKKKYSKNQIGYLIAICFLKSTVSMADMSLLLEMDKGISPSKERLYEFWCQMETDILKDASFRALAKVDIVSKRFDAEKDTDPDKADENARNALGYLALRLAIQAQANKLLSDFILAKLRLNLHGEEKAKTEITVGKKESKHASIASHKNAKRVAKAKKQVKTKEK